MKAAYLATLACTAALLAGCESYGGGYGPSSTRVSVGYYHGSGWYDPYYRNRCCYNTVVVRPPGYRPRPPGYRPPPGNRPPPAQLPARPRPPPRPMPRPTLRR